MFTGIVERTATVVELTSVATGARLRLNLAEIVDELTLGESVAVNGCCLTVAELEDGGAVAFDLLEETLRRTNLGDLESGGAVNIERALRANDRLSGHFVQGHVDCRAGLIGLNASGQDHELIVALPPEFSRYAIRKGSICVDGMSLTIADLQEDRFTIWITPHTFKVTNLRARKTGQSVNLEFDLLAKYLERLGVSGNATT